MSRACSLRGWRGKRGRVGAGVRGGTVGGGGGGGRRMVKGVRIEFEV